MQKRVAHTPTLKVTTGHNTHSPAPAACFSHNLCSVSDSQSGSLKRPIIPTEFGAKVPTNIRQRYLETFIDECVKFCSSEEDAFQMV